MARSIEVDWVFIKVNTVRKMIAILAVGLIAAALVFYARWRMNPDPDVKAKRAIEAARTAHKEARTQPLPEAWVGELEQAEGQLAAAQEAYTEEDWESAINEADSALFRFEALAGASNNDVGVGQFSSVGGRVSVQRAGKSEWDPVSPQIPVFNGDFVKSGRDGTAEIMFSDGTMYRISPNSLLEIHHKGRQSGKEDSGTVTMKVGKVNVFTSGSKSTVETDTARTEIKSDSQVELGVSEERTDVTAYRGGAKVKNPMGQEVEVGPRERISTAVEAGFSEKTRIPDPPEPLEPHNNTAFEMAKNPEIRLNWRVRAETSRIHLQVSRSKHFLADRIDVDNETLRKNSARLEAIAPGTYFWRIAGVGREGVRSEWSEVRRFRIYTQDRRPLLKDHTPPELVVNPLSQLGHMFIVEGNTEVGATVTVNGERVEVDSSGHFRKAIEVRKNGWNEIVIAAIDPSGNRTERSEKVNVEVY